jgi:hypothetical protein
MVLDLTSRTEKLLTRLGMWGAVQGSSSLVVALILSVALLESLAPSVVRLLSPGPVNSVHVFAVGIGLLLGMIGYFAGDVWDRVVFEAWYGPQGKWLDAARRPFLVFPAGSALKRARAQAAQALPRKPDTPDTEKGVYREAVKIARRQAERWERIEHPLILSRFLRGLLWPCLFVACLVFCFAAILPGLGAATKAPPFLLTGGGCLALALLCLVPYSHLRVEHMLRLYQDVAAHHTKKKPERR